MTTSPQSVLIYRLGSLGDTVVALPALHLVANAFPNARRYLLTNININAKAAPMAQVLEGSGLVHGYLEYPIGVRDPRVLMKLIRQIRSMHFDMLIYLAEPRGSFVKTLRDAAFFKICGIRELIGVPYSRDRRHCRLLDGDRYEYEGARLLRCIHGIGEMRLEDPMSFKLALTAPERQVAAAVLGALDDGRPLLAASVGAKVDVKDWGDDNWNALLTRVGSKFREWGLVMLGSADERRRSAELLRHWPGQSLNLCGLLNIRQSAAVLERCRLYVGHDSGPMHLAAAVGTPCAAIFSSRNLPGEWFPYGKQHRVIYHRMECQGCRRDVCVDRQKACIRSVSVDEAMEKIIELTRNPVCSVQQRDSNAAIFHR